MNKLFKVLRIFVTTLFIISLVVVSIVYGFLNKIQRPYSKAEPPQHERIETPVPEQTTTSNRVAKSRTVRKPKTRKPKTEKSMISILLIGEDSRNSKDRGRSDAMVVATFDLKSKRILLTSFMRDLYVEIPDKSFNRLNHAYQIGGMPLLKDTIEKNFLVDIDGNIAVNFNSFEKFVNAVNGIDIEISQREAAYLGYEKAGVVNMDGRKALVYARLRSIGNSDYDRTARQRKLVESAYKKFIELNPAQTTNLLNDFLPLVTTDMSNVELIRLGWQVRKFGDVTPEMLRIPIDGGYKSETIRGMAVLKPDLEKNRKALKDQLGQ